MVRLIPRETKFFQMFSEVAENVTEGARLMKALLEDYHDVPNRVGKLKEIEHRGDDMTHAILTKLNQTFITPFIAKISTSWLRRWTMSLLLNSAGDRLITYKIDSVPPASVTLAALILQQSIELGRAVAMLEKNHHVLEHCVEINRLRTKLIA